MTVRFSLLRLSAPRAAWLLSLVLPVFAWAPLLYPGYFELHSGFLPVFNLNDLVGRGFDLAWLPHIGQGYDVLRGEGVLAYWLGALARLVGLGPAAAVKAVFGLSLVSASAGMYAWARPRLGGWPGLVAASVYTLAPVALATIYVRGAYAETVFLGILPWAMLGADLAGARRRSGAAILGLALAAALLTQLGLGLWLAAILLLYVLVGRHDNRKPALFGWAAGAGLGLLWLIPTLIRAGTGEPAVVFAEHLVYPHQLLGLWGSGPSVPGPADTLTFNLGLMAYGLAVAGLVLRHDPPPRGPGSGSRHPLVFPAVAFAVLLFLTTTLASPLWRMVSFLSGSLTYPWQLLLLALPWGAWLAGAGARQVLALGAGGTVSHMVPLAAGILALVLLPTYADLRPTTTRVAVGSAPLAVYGENEIALLSAAPDGIPRPGGDVAVEVRWQALRPLEHDYTVFFHVIGPDGQRYAQQDTIPGAGARPTTGWTPGEIITDRYVVTLPQTAPSGNYEYWLGFYDVRSEQRLPASGDDKYVLPVTGGGG